MVAVTALAFVFLAGLVTALATGLGAIPFFLVDDIGDRWNVALWGIASGIMLSASLFGLVDEGLAESPPGTPWLLVGGLLAGVVLVVVADRILETVDVGGTHRNDDARTSDDHRHDHEAPDGGHHHEDAPEAGGHDHAVDPAAFVDADRKRLVLILGVLTVHSFPEGVAVGVAFADLGLEGGVDLFGVAVPVLAIFMTVAISIHNVPEGVAISIPLRAMGVGEWRMVGAAVFSSLPQPIGAVLAFAFVRWAREFLPFGFGFAAGAMIYLVLSEFIPDALEAGADLPRGGVPELAVGLLVGFAVMLPLLFVA